MSENVLIIAALILLAGWMLGVFMYHLDGLIHMLLALSVLCVIIRAILGSGTTNSQKRTYK